MGNSICRLIAVAGIVYVLAVLAAAEPRIYSDGNQSGMNYLNAVRYNGSLLFSQLVNPPVDTSSSNVLIGYTAGGSTWNTKDLVGAGGYGAVSAVQTAPSSGLEGGADQGTVILVLNRTDVNTSIDNRVSPTYQTILNTLTNYVNYSSCSDNNVWQYTSGCTATDGTGDCGAGSVCLGGHTHSQYLTSAVTNLATGLGLSGGPITTTGTVSIDPSVVLNRTSAATLYVNRSDWTSNDDYPGACVGSNYVQGIGDTLTCANVNTTIDSRLVNLYTNATLQDARIVSLESNASAQDSRIVDLESNATSQDSRIVALEGVDTNLWSNATSQDARIVAIEGAYMPSAGGTFSDSVYVTGDLNATGVICDSVGCIGSGGAASTSFSDASWIDSTGSITSNSSVNSGNVNITGNLTIKNIIFSSTNPHSLQIFNNVDKTQGYYVFEFNNNYTQFQIWDSNGDKSSFLNYNKTASHSGIDFSDWTIIKDESGAIGFHPRDQYTEWLGFDWNQTSGNHPEIRIHNTNEYRIFSDISGAGYERHRVDATFTGMDFYVDDNSRGYLIVTNATNANPSLTRVGTTSSNGLSLDSDAGVMVKTQNLASWSHINASDFNDMVADEIEKELFENGKKATDFSLKRVNEKLDISNAPKTVFGEVRNIGITEDGVSYDYNTTSVSVGEGVVWNSLQIEELKGIIEYQEDKISAFERRLQKVEDNHKGG